MHLLYAIVPELVRTDWEVSQEFEETIRLVWFGTDSAGFGTANIIQAGTRDPCADTSSRIYNLDTRGSEMGSFKTQPPHLPRKSPFLKISNFN